MRTDGDVRRHLRIRRSTRDHVCTLPRGARVGARLKLVAQVGGHARPGPATVHVLCMNMRRIPPTATKSAPIHIERFSAVVGASWLLSRPERDLKTGAATEPLPSPDQKIRTLRLCRCPPQPLTSLDCPCSVRNSPALDVFWSRARERTPRGVVSETMIGGALAASVRKAESRSPAAARSRSSTTL